MIIVETKNGMVFVNNKQIIAGEHDKKQKKFFVKAPDHVITIDNVERVRYINDEKDIEIEDAGTKLQELMKDHNKLIEWSQKMRSEYMKLINERDELEEQLKKIGTHD